MYYVPLIVENYLITICISITGLLGILYSLYQFYQIKKIHLSPLCNDNRECYAILENQEYPDIIDKVNRVYKAIKDGANAFLWAEYKYMFIFIVLFDILIFLLVGSAKNCGTIRFTNNMLINQTGNCWFKGLFTAISFTVGSLSSMLAGFIGMRIAVFTNARTTISAQKSWNKAFLTAYKGGSIMGFTLCSIGILVLYCIINLFALYWDPSIPGNNKELFESIAGFGLGASSIALFGRVAGGIYTKAADVGADLVGKIEQDIPEDDPRNPAVIADNVGDNVGDVAGMGSDLFGSFAEATCAALVISAASPDLSRNWTSLLFPVMISTVGILSGILTTFVTKCKTILEEKDIELSLKLQLILSTLLTTPFLVCITKVFLPKRFCVELSNNIKTLDFEWVSNSNPDWCSHVSTNNNVLICILIGLWSGLIIGYFTEYMTSHSYKPVRELSKVCDKGSAVNIIYGIALGNMSTIVPCICIAITVFFSFYLANMYGIAIAALGMLSTLSIGLTIDVYGPISDNAGGIAEMCGFDESVRDKTDALDAAGNTTAAIGKGFAIGSAALVSLALFGAFVTRTGLYITGVNILNAEVFPGLLIGAMLPYIFSAMCMKSVGKAAQEMVEEVRRQFRENSNILEGTCDPDYNKCIEISTKASLKEMILPGLLVILTPIITGTVFGIRFLSGLLSGSLVSGIQMAIASSNMGGAWDNAKKYIEKGNHGGKGSSAHKAAITGDTVGDPLKDTSGPAINILMKLMAIISLVFADFFVKYSIPSQIAG